MKIAAATDYIGSTGCPERPLRLLAEAGFTHLHWCHQWCTDFLYSQHEINAYKKMLKNFGLTLLDIHGSQGQEKCWYSELEYQRKAGKRISVIKNTYFSERFGSTVVNPLLRANRKLWKILLGEINKKHAKIDALGIDKKTFIGDYEQWLQKKHRRRT